MSVSARVSLRGASRATIGLDPRDIAAEIERTQVEIMFRSAPGALVAAFTAAMLLVFGARHFYQLSPDVAVGWIAVQFSTFFFLECTAFFYWRSPAATRNWRLWAKLFVTGTGLGGFGWGLGAILLLAPSGLEEELLIVLVISALASGTVLALGSYLPATFAHFLPLTLPLMVWSVTRGDEMHYFLATLGLAYIGAISALAAVYSANLRNSIRLEIEKRSLATSLQVQVQTSEQANQAKSQFLASASHDLRQPVHALSMFVGALLDKPLPADSRHIVEQMSGAVESMDGLFNSLLDISKLDAGIVKSHAQSFPIARLLRRMRSEFQSAAESKGLRLIVCDSSVIVHSDAILLENILRNLVSNAVKYTERGGVLIGCRRGEKLCVEVLDTGIGIPPGQLERVFEEFFQAGNAERERARGLGLGLAIVKRTAALIACDVEMESAPGCGTVAKVFVPLAADQTRRPLEPQRALTSRRAPAVIFVIDDEAAIREAMKGLLEAWGRTVIAADSGQQIFERALTCPSAPDLVICDYRLREEENGIQLMNRLREEYNDEIAGILLTGDTAAGRLVEAEDSGYPVLHKPLSSARLAAAIEAALAERRVRQVS